MVAPNAAADAHPPVEQLAPVEQLDALTSLRFVAAMYVLLFHYVAAFPGGSPNPNFTRFGYTGVTFFFILSGFILAHNYHAVDFGERLNRYRFFAARISRIYPVYLLSLLVSLPFALSALVKMPPGLLRNLAASSGLLAPLGMHAWVPGASCAINCPAWSISTEFFFYLLFPFLVWRVMRSPGLWLAVTLGPWAIICIVYAVLWGAVAPGGSIIAHNEGTAPALLAQAIKYFPVGRLPEFVLGIVLYALWKRYRGQIELSWALAAFAGAAVLFAMIANHLPEILIHNGLTAVVWAPLILAAASMRGGLLCSPLAIFLGRISFALYLFHFPVLLAFLSLDKQVFGSRLAQYPASAIAAVTLMALLVATLVYLRFEEASRRPVFRWLSRRWGLPDSRSPRPAQ